MPPPHVAARCYNSNVITGSRVPLASDHSRHQSNLPCAPVPPANPNHVSHVQPVSVNVQTPFARQPVVRYKLPVASVAQLNSRDVQAQQQLFQQQFLLQLAAAAGNSLSYPCVIAPMPLLVPPCIPGSGTHRGPTVNPVLQQSVDQSKLTDEWGKHQVRGKVDDVPRQPFIISCTAPCSSVSVVTKSTLLPSCSLTSTPVASTARSCSSTTSERTSLKSSNYGEGFDIAAVSMSAYSTKMCEPIVTDKKPFEADNLPQRCNVNQYEDSSLSAVKLLQTVSLPQNSGRGKCETESSCSPKQLTKAQLDFFLSLQHQRTSSEACNTRKSRAGSALHEERATSLPAVCETVECEAGDRITQEELKTTSVSENAHIVSSSLPLHTDILPTLPLSPFGFRSSADSKTSPGISLVNPVTAGSWSGTPVKQAGNLASLGHEDSPLDWADSEADWLVRSVTGIIEDGSLNETEINCGNSWLNTAPSQDEILTKPVDAKNIWSNAAVNLYDSHLNTCHTSSTEQNRMLQSSVIGTGSAFGCDTSAAGHVATSTVLSNHCKANAAKTGLYNQQDIWPTTFGPFTRLSDSTSDSVCCRPPGLETEVLARIGVIGQRGSPMRHNASVEGSDSGVESVNDDSRGSVSNCSSGELLIASSSSSETAVCATASVRSHLFDADERESVVRLQEMNTTDDSMFSNTSVLTVTARIVSHETNVPMVPAKPISDGEFETLEHRPFSCSFLPIGALQDDSFVASVSSHSDVNSTVKQTATTRSEMGTSDSLRDTVEETLCTDNTVQMKAQLFDMLCKSPLIREVLHSLDTRSVSVVCDKLAASSSANCSSEDGDLAETMSKTGP